MKKIDRIESRNRQQHNSSRRFQYPFNNRTTRQRINKEAEDWNNTIEKMDPKDTFRTFNPMATEFTFSSSALRIFSRVC